MKPQLLLDKLKLNLQLAPLDCAVVCVTQVPTKMLLVLTKPMSR